jgi:two-component system, OmpR family, sensor histidine kinase CpxA
MNVKYPLYLQTLMFLFLHMFVLLMLFLLFFNTQFGMGWGAIVNSPLGERVDSIAALIHEQTPAASAERWNEVLRQFGKLYGVRFYIFDRHGRQVAGEPIVLPDQVREFVIRRHQRVGGEQGAPGERVREYLERGERSERGDMQSLMRGHEHLPHGRFFTHTEQPQSFWIGTRFGIRVTPPGEDVLPSPNGPTVPGTLLAMTNNLWTSKLLFDPTGIAITTALIFVLSILIWLPFVFRVTHAVAALTSLTERIAEGRFDARLHVKGHDEIGALALAINSMAERLETFVWGQKRFLGDTAHELCSPVARLQIALELLEESAIPEQETVIGDLREDVEEMSNLINELLAFSKAGLQGKDVELQAVDLKSIIGTVLSKNSCDKLVTISVVDDRQVIGDQLLLERAFGNIIRNALRYAGDDGPINVSCAAEGEAVKITVTDCGPGVPADALKLLGQPFFRPEASRSRNSGGVGLGLAIVKTCVESCGGTVKVRNRQPHGLQVEVLLKACPSSETNVERYLANC